MFPYDKISFSKIELIKFLRQLVNPMPSLVDSKNIVDKFMEVFSIDNALDKTDVTHFINLCAMVNRGEIVVEHGELFPGKRQPLSNQEFISKLE